MVACLIPTVKTNVTQLPVLFTFSVSPTPTHLLHPLASARILVVITITVIIIIIIVVIILAGFALAAVIIIVFSIVSAFLAGHWKAMTQTQADYFHHLDGKLDGLL
jgi:hypothetical protein